MQLHVEYWPISRLKPYLKNPRKNDGAVDRMVASIKEFGFSIPILARSTGEVVDGHLRLKAALKLGMAEVPVIPCDGWSEAQVKAFRLMVNRSVTWAEWDTPQLAVEFGELQAMHFDLKMTGFDPFEIKPILEADWRLWNGADGVTPEWAGMPEFEQEDQLAWQTVRVHFVNAADRDAFGALLGERLTDKTKYIWYPKQARISHLDKRYVSDKPLNPEYPVYIVSKGRSDSRLTSKALEAIGVPYRIVVEPQERDTYAAVIDPAKILILPFSNLGQGSIPARNWIWEHAISEGHLRHWVLDDNIKKFYRMHQNFKGVVADGTVFRAAEEFIERYENIGLAGFQYQYLAKQKQAMKPWIVNTRIYSCILIDNALPFRWRGRYNEDTDLSLRALKHGWCTVLFLSFLAEKITTLTMKGGNTDELYQGDGRLEMAKSLQEQHPDVVKITQKWGRWQHQVDYRPFKANKFIPKPGFQPPTETDNYGMELINI